MHITADISILNDVYAQLTGSVSSFLSFSLSLSFFLSLLCQLVLALGLFAFLPRKKSAQFYED